jgi:hypothetical protein
MQAIVSQMNIEEEQKSRELEQQIAEIQDKDLCRQQPAVPLNQNLRHPHVPAFTLTAFQGLNYLDERSPLAHSSGSPLGHKTIEQALTPSTTAVRTHLSTS